ncbi:type IV pili twitching motility protein PilT, partial [Candidatus Calescamantes bacterium]|nr:type IV pili twitching motility protein PilT [Candidatus Calescamantes bacterium]
RATGSGRVAAFEIMVAIPAIQSLIRERKTYRITSFIQTGARYGMKTLDQHLFELYSRGIVSYEEIMIRAQNPEELQQKVEGKA